MCEYAGWRNYETWAVNSWFLTPEQHEHWQEIARQCIRRHGANTEDAIHELAKLMHESILKGVVEGQGVYSQIVDHAIKTVDWYSIAKGFID